MESETRSRTRKGQKAKTVPTGTSGAQRSLREMFGSSGKPKERAILQEPEIVAIELSDSSSEVEVPPTTSEEATQANVTSELDSDTSMPGDEPPVQLVQPPSPKKVFSIFERQKPPAVNANETALQELDHNSIYVSDDDSCTEESTPYERKAGQHLFSVASSSSGKSHKHKQGSTLLRQGSSRELPIVVDGLSKLQRSTTINASSSKPVYSIFAPKQRTESKTVACMSGKVAPFPCKENQHVDGLQPVSPVFRPPSYFPHSDRGKKPLREPLDNNYSLKRICSTYPMSPDQTQHLEQVDVDVDEYIKTIPRLDQVVPAVSRLLQHAQGAAERNFMGDFSREQWTDKWRPRKAEQVLGNQSHALHLRDWLAALRLQGDAKEPTGPSQSTTGSAGRKRKLARKKKPYVVRHVKKRQRRGLDDYMQDFLASEGSSESEEELLTAPSSDFDDLAFSDDPPIGANASYTGSSRMSSPLTGLSEDEIPKPAVLPPRRFRRQLMNTMLLAGPSGSGKTASVYACAEELGFEIFEVYPGMGERSGASLNRLVGDVGKNHVVQVKRQRSPEVHTAQKNFFQPRAARKPTRALRRTPDSFDVESLPDDLDIISVSEPEETAALEPLRSTITQSLILVEEVDVVYQTDTNFWPALINIIKDCRRPVILTCNDTSLVPCQDLPLQEILHFQPCPSPLATSYLQALCLAEGRRCSRQELTRVYDSLDNLSYPCFDIRHAIDHLQFMLTKIPSSSYQPPALLSESNCISISTSPVMLAIPELSDLFTRPQVTDAKGLEALRDMDRIRDIQSFVDAQLSQETNTSLWNLYTAEHSSSANDELGYTFLNSDLNADSIPVSSFYHQDQALIRDVLHRSHNVFRPANSVDTVCTDAQAASLEVHRRMYLATAGVALRSLSPSHTLTSDPALHLDLAPSVRHIMEVVEPIAQTKQASQTGSQGRTTRNSQRTDSWRWLPLSDAERATLSSTSLKMDWFV